VCVAALLLLSPGLTAALFRAPSGTAPRPDDDYDYLFKGARRPPPTRCLRAGAG